MVINFLKECKECPYNNFDKSCFGYCETYPANGNILKQIPEADNNKLKKEW